MSTTIKDVAFLDLTKASEETLKEIKAIKNVATMVYNEQFEQFMSKISFYNVASSVKISGNFTSLNGRLEFDGNFAASMKEPMAFFINGNLVIKPDVTPDMIDQTISGLFINGVIYCPENIQGAVQQKIEQINGKVKAYMNDAVLEMGKLTIDNDYLRQLQPNTNLAVTGKVNMTGELDGVLLDEKLHRVQFLKGAVISEANHAILQEKVIHSSEKVVVIPKGYTYIDEDLHLDSSVIRRFEQAKLFVAGLVSFDNDVTPAAVKTHIEQIKTSEEIYCKKELVDEVLQKCDASTKVIPYSGTLKIVDGQYKLMKTELEYTPNPIFFVVRGMLEVDGNVEPQVIYDKVERIDLYGMVTGTTEQCGVLQTKLGINHGLVSDDSEESEEQGSETLSGEDTVIANVAHLKL